MTPYIVPEMSLAADQIYSKRHAMAFYDAIIIQPRLPYHMHLKVSLHRTALRLQSPHALKEKVITLILPRTFHTEDEMVSDPA